MPSSNDEPINDCPDHPTVAEVTDETFARSDGVLDRNVTITRSCCGSTYFWGGQVDAPLPEVGDPAMRCLGPQVELPFSGLIPLESGPITYEQKGRGWKKVNEKKNKKRGNRRARLPTPTDPPRP